MKILFLISLSAFLAFKIVSNNPYLLDLKKNYHDENLKWQSQNRPMTSFKVNQLTGLQKPTFQYRYNLSRNGVITDRLNLPLKLLWTKSDMNFMIHGASKSSAAVDKEVIVVATDTSWVYCFNHEGALIWRFFVSESVRGIHSTPLLTDQAVIFGAYNGRLYALDKKTGTPLWVNVVGGAIGASALLDKGKIYVSVETTKKPYDGYLIKVDANTGEVEWKSDYFGEQAHSSPALNSQLGALFVGANSSKLFAISSEDGKTLWTYNSVGPIKGTPTLDEKNVYFTDWGGNLYSLKQSGGEVNWAFRLGEKSQSSPTLIADLKTIIVSANNKSIFAINSEKGDLIWKKQTNFDRMTGSSSAFKSDNGLWGVILPCSSSEVCVLDAKSGAEMQSFEVGGIVSSVPTVFENKVYITTDQNNFYVFGR